MLQGLQEEYDSTIILMITHSPSLVDNLDGRIESVREDPNSSYESGDIPRTDHGHYELIYLHSIKT